MATLGTPNTTSSSTPSPHRRGLQRSQMSWTDDLPQCQLSDLGGSTNVVYLADGRVTEAYPYEDRAFNFSTDNDCYLYGVFDGYDGSRAAHFASERLPAELLLGQLTPRVNEAVTKSILQQAFGVVERGFFESIDIELAKKTHLQSQLPDRISADLAEKRYPGVVQQIRALNDAIKGGTTAVVALMVNDNLYIANVGDSRALLCQGNQHGRIDVRQITVNHDINNEHELNRLSRLGLNVQKIMERGRLGMNECTRCIGDYSVKGGYKDNEILCEASSEPVIAIPDIFGPIPISEIQDGFLVLMSDDVYKSLEQATNTKNANEDIASMVSHELLTRNSITGVAQNVIDKISFLHRRGFGKSHTFSRGDITLVVRNINHNIGADALPDIQALLPDLSGRHPVSVPYKRNSVEFGSSGEDFSGGLSGKPPVSLSLVMPGHGNESENEVGVRRSRGNRRSHAASDDTPTNLTAENNVSISLENILVQPADPLPANDELFYRCDLHEPMETDADSRVKPYVSFANFDEEAWLQMKSGKKDATNAR